MAEKPRDGIAMRGKTGAPRITYGSGKKVETPIFGPDPTLERRERDRRHRNIALDKYYDEEYRKHLQREASYERAKTATERKIDRKIKKSKGGAVKSSRKKNINGIGRGKTRARSS